MDDSQTPQDVAAPQSNSPVGTTPQTLEQALAIIAAQQTRIAELASEAKDRRLKGNTQKTELETMQQQLAEALQQINAVKDETQKEREARLQAERRVLTAEITRQYNLPQALAERLQGTTKEELEADAKSLMESFPKPATQHVVVSPGNNADIAAPKLADFDGVTDYATINHMFEQMKKKT